MKFLKLWFKIRNLDYFLIGVALTVIMFIATFLLNLCTSVFINLRMISMPIFFLSSSIGLYVFLFREKKETSRGNIYKSVQQKFFEAILVVNLISICLFLIFPKISFILLTILGSVYVFFLYVTLFFTNNYRSSICSVKYLNRILRYLKKNSDDKNNRFILEYINERLFITMYSLNYINRHLEINKAEALINELNEFHENIKVILLGNESENDFYIKALRGKTEHEDSEIDDTLKSIYHNYLNELKNIVLSKEISEDISSKVFQLVYDCIPIIQYRKFLNDNANEGYDKLEKKYSVAYNNAMKTILTEVSTNFNTDNEVIYREYTEKIYTSIKEAKYFSEREFSKIQSYAHDIECTTLLEFVLANNLKGVINFISCILIKKNTLDSISQSNLYLKSLILINIKAVELTNYEVAGYLTKVISSNYSHTEINQEFKDIKSEYGQSERKDRRVPIVIDIGEKKLLLHGISFEYCWYKCYLIYKAFNFKNDEFNLDLENTTLSKRIKEKIRFDSEKFSIEPNLLENI